MKKMLAVGSLCVLVSLLLIPLSAAVQSVPEPVADESVLASLPVWAQQQLKPVLKENLQLASTLTLQLSVLKSNGTGSFLAKIWTMVLTYKLCRLAFALAIYSQTNSKFMLYRVSTWAVRIVKWVRIGVLLGVITPSEPQTIPTIYFSQDSTNRTLTVVSVDRNVSWSTIDQIGKGTCDPLPTGNVTAGQMITNCTGTIVLRYIPMNAVLYVADFP